MKKHLYLLIKTLSIITLIIIVTGIFYFYHIFQCNKDNLPKIYIYAIRSEPFRIKGIRYLSYVSNNIRIPHIYLDKVRIKARGGVSEDFPKHNFTIELSEKHPLAGLKSDDDWILAASFIDKSFIRNKLSYDLFRAFNKKNIAPQCQYIEVYKNFRYNGLYILMERMDRKRLGIAKSDTNACIFKEPAVFADPDIFATSNPYIKGDIHHQKYPEFPASNKNYYMEKIRRFIKESPDSVFFSESKGIQTYFDIDNIIDWHILLLVTHNIDGVVKNFYLYKENSNAAFKIVPWDYDHSFGRDGDNEPHSPGIVNVLRNYMIKRLMSTPGYRIKLKQRFGELVKSGILTPDNIISMVDKDYKFLKKYAEKNEKKWPVNAKVFYDNSNFTQETESIKKWIPLQLNEVKNYIDNL